LVFVATEGRVNENVANLIDIKLFKLAIFYIIAKINICVSLRFKFIGDGRFEKIEFFLVPLLILVLFVQWCLYLGVAFLNVVHFILKLFDLLLI
jgi:hypothetical protein